MWNGGIAPVILDLGFQMEVHSQVHPTPLPRGLPPTKISGAR